MTCRQMPRERLVLASASPRRRSLMREAGYRFSVIPSPIRERSAKAGRPSWLVKRLAMEKALSVSTRYPAHVVLGADTVVYCKGRIVGKPRSVAHAKRILRDLSGTWQRVYTGVAIVWNGGRSVRCGYAVSSVKMKPLQESHINKAISRHLDKAGAYAVQQKKDPFVEKIEGDYDNVVGLPLGLVKRLLAGAL